MSTDLYSIILPTYNEKENIPLIVYFIDKYMKEAGHRYEVVVVEDNSPDGTLGAVKKLQKIYGEKLIKVLSRPSKLGLGSAYMDGIKLCNGNFVFLMDADLSHHPRHMNDFIVEQKMCDYDVVTGTRYRHGGGVAGWDLRRIITSRGANFLANIMLNPGVSDLTGSFRLYKRSVLETLIAKVKSKSYVFQMEIIVRAKNSKFSVAEVPVTFVDRLYGESKLGSNEIVSYLQGLWKLFVDIRLGGSTKEE